jgi:hypothetical protein
MRLEVERERGERLDDALRTLIAADPYLAYANFAPIATRPGALHALHLGHWRAAADALGVLVARDAGRPLGVLRLDRRDFESQHFGMAVARIDVPLAVADEPTRLAALRALYAAAIGILRAQGYDHVTTGASTQDRIGCWAVQEAGAFHVGTKISWMQALTGSREPNELPAPLRLDVFERAEIPRLPAASWRRLLAWTAEAFDRGPFVFDLDVPRERAAAIYQVWTEKAMTGEWADALLVVRDGDDVVAFHTMMRLPELSAAAGVGILGRGIGGTLPGYRGLFTALQRATAAVRPLGARYLENETQSATIPSINVFGKLGHQCLRSVASFHMRLAPGGARHAGGSR